MSGQVSIKYGFKGPNHAVVTACATGAHSIGDAAEMIKRGAADVMIAGGAEAAVCRLGEWQVSVLQEVSLLIIMIHLLKKRQDLGIKIEMALLWVKDPE